MGETNTIWDWKLTAFREKVASAGQTATGVSVAAVSAALGASLLQMVLAIIARRATFAGDPEKLSALRRDAGSNAEQLMRCADADITAYHAYREARRAKAPDTEIERRQRVAIGVPLEAARCSLATLHLCAEAGSFVRGAIAADLATAAILLESAVRAMLLCVKENLRRLPVAKIDGECAALEEGASGVLREVLHRVQGGVVLRRDQ